MKKSTKILLIGGILLVLVGGLMMLITGGILGGQKVKALIENGDLSVELGDLGLVGYHFDSDENTQNEEQFAMGKQQIGTGADIKNLDIDFGAGEFEIVESEDEYIYLEINHSIPFEYGIDKEQTLYVKPKGKVISSATGEITLYLPQDMVFDEVDFDLGAGEMVASKLETKELEISVGAGAVTLKNLKCDVADMEVGAGEMIVNNGDVKILSLDLAMGEARLNLAGTEEDYDYDLSCGAGEVKIGSMYSDGVAFDKDTDFGREKEINVQCAMGTVTVDFAE